MFPENTLRTYLLHQLLASVKLPLDELAHAHLAVLKVPPLTQQGFEHDLLRMVSKIRQVGPQVAILVFPQERRQAQTALWVHKWNRINHIPFVFVKTCVCAGWAVLPPASTLLCFLASPTVQRETLVYVNLSPVPVASNWLCSDACLSA